MGKKSRARRTKASSTAPRGRSAPVMTDVELSGGCVAYTYFLVGSKRMPLFWVDPDRCKSDFDGFFEALQTSRGDDDVRSACREYPEVVESMKHLIGDAAPLDIDAVHEVWERARSTMLCVTREYCVGLYKNLL